MHPQRTVEARYMDVETAGEYISVIKPIPDDPDTARTRRRQRQRMYTMVYRREIPHSKIGKRLFFDKQALDKWMRSGAH
jgi:hypothetical protein